MLYSRDAGWLLPTVPIKWGACHFLICNDFICPSTFTSLPSGMKVDLKNVGAICCNFLQLHSFIRVTEMKENKAVFAGNLLRKCVKVCIQSSQIVGISNFTWNSETNCVVPAPNHSRTVAHRLSVLCHFAYIVFQVSTVGCIESTDERLVALLPVMLTLCGFVPRITSPFVGIQVGFINKVLSAVGTCGNRVVRNIRLFTPFFVYFVVDSARR